MIVFISDLHLGDKPDDGLEPSDRADGFNLSHRAVDVLHRQVKELVDDSEETCLKLVLLGDIFDMTHTDFWLDVDQTPWDGDRGLTHVPRLLDKIIDDNSEFLGKLRDTKEHVPGLECFEIVYVPGNHDRLCNLLPETRQRIRECFRIGLTDADGNYSDDAFEWEYTETDHRVYAYHGCQLDEFNWRPPIGSDQPESPPGDALTAMLLSRIPGDVYDVLLRDGVDDDCAAGVRDNLKVIFDVRPVRAILPFIFREIDAHAKTPETFRGVLEGISVSLGKFRAMPFVRRSCRRVWKLRLLLAFLSLVVNVPWMPALNAAMFVLWPIIKCFRGRSIDDYLDEASDHVKPSDGDRIDYVVAGHTHEPVQRAVHVDRGERADDDPKRKAKIRECIYLNTGTWRPRYEGAHNYNGFIAMKGLSHVVIYSPLARTEDMTRTVETWTGMLKDDDVKRGDAPHGAS